MSSSDDQLTISQKHKLLIEACELATEMETRGRLMKEHQPKVEIVSSNYDETYLTTSVRLVFPDGKIGEAANWGGMGKDLEESIQSNLWCLQSELEERIVKMQLMLARLKKAAPTSKG